MGNLSQIETQQGGMSRRNFLKLGLKLTAGAIVVGGTTKWIVDTLSESDDVADNSGRHYFDSAYYKKFKNLSDTPLINRHVLLEKMPTAYDNIIYAQDIALAKNIEQTTTYQNCSRITLIDHKIQHYASQYGIPYAKLAGLIMLESAGKANAGSKSGCYGYCQLNRPIAKQYGAIVNGKDYRDNIDHALDACCRFLTDMHNKYNDENRSITFAGYHMGETHMRAIISAANKTDTTIKTFQDILSVNDSVVADTIMSLKDESYKYYPRLLAAGRVFEDFKSNRGRFNRQLQSYLNMPITRKPSLAEEYIRFGDKQFKTFDEIKKDMEQERLYSVKNNDKIAYHHVGTLTKDPEQKELLKMTTPCVLGMINLITSHLNSKVKISSLTRPQEYNDIIYRNKGSNVTNKWTSHATGYTVDFGFFGRREETNHLAYILYMLECQGKISFLKERDHFHVNINPEFKKYFESLID